MSQRKFKLLKGDCVRLLKKASLPLCDLVLTDPPYGISFQSNQRVQSEKFKVIANDDKPFVDWVPHIVKHMKPVSALLCFHRWDVQDVFAEAIRKSGLKIRAQIIWDKQVHGMGDLEGSPAPMHENIWFAVKGDYKFPKKSSGGSWRAGEQRRTTVIHCPREPSAHVEHSNQKPLHLLTELVEGYCAQDGIVLDPFTGSGSTGVASMIMGRRFVGIELDEDYYKLAEQNLLKAEKRWKKRIIIKSDYQPTALF